MKKFIYISLCLLLLIGCSNQKSKEEANTLKVSMDLKFPPFMYIDDNNEIAGLEVEIAKAFADYLDMELEIVNTDFSMIIPSLETGESDIAISDMSITSERLKKIDFSIPYRYSRAIALINKDYYEENGISDDMSAEKLFSLEGIKPIGLASTISISIPNKYGVEATEVTEIASALMEINTGLSNVLIGSNTVIQDHSAYSETTELYFGLPEYFDSAFAISKGNEELVKKANEFIDEMYSEGGLYSKLASKYDPIIKEYLKNEELGLDYIVQKPTN
ncbi:MAG: transporter substrate-binding domain-containing protein [Pleomorphochaeta sp.]